MAEKIESVASTDKADRLKVMAQVAMKRVRDFGLPGFVAREPEYAKLEDALKKNKKPVNFTLRFENEKLVAAASCVGTVLTMAALDVGKEKDREKHREMLDKVRSHSDLFTNADLAAWDKKNPDPIKLASLKADVLNLKKAVENASKGVARVSTFNAMKDNEKDYLFLRWMEKKGYGDYVDFLNEQRYGRDAKGLFDDYLADNAKTKKLLIKDDTRKALTDAVAQNKKPVLDKAVKELTNTVDKLVPAYYDDLEKTIKANLPSLKKMLADKQAELKAMTG
jgi:hypothetical protein